MNPALQTFELDVHRDSACPAVRTIEVEVDLPGAAALRLRYRICGDVRGLRMPPPGTSTRQDQLWQHTCFEVFVKGSAESYCEFNFAPSRQWAAWCFDGYRSGMQPAQLSVVPRIDVRSLEGGFELEVIIDLNALANFDPGGPTQIGLAAVIEDSDGSLSHWALSHPPGNADFHHSDGFVLALKDNGACTRR